MLMAKCFYATVNCRDVLLAPKLAGSLLQPFNSSLLASSPNSSQSLSLNHAIGRTISRKKIVLRKEKGSRIVSSLKGELKVMISGAPGSGKETLCEMIVQKFGLVYVSIGDILRAEVAAGTETGNRAREYMDSGDFVPEEIVTPMATARLSLQDVKEKGWLLDGYPQTLEQANGLETLNIGPDVYIMLEVSDDILIDRCVGRRLDPLTGKIYHLKDFPPENEEIKGRLLDFPENSEDKVKSRLEIYKKSAESIVSAYSTIMKRIDGNRPTEAVFEEIDYILSRIQLIKKGAVISGSSSQNVWRGIPTRLNNIPHSREIRNYFYEDVLQATQRAVINGKTRLRVEVSIPELNPEMDVYRIGTLMELVRVLALSFAHDGKRVKVCVQGSMGEGALSGMPLQLAGSRKILEFMDWGDDGAIGTFIKFGSVGGKEVEEQDDMFILVAPQNAVGNCIIDDLKAMTDAAAHRPVILVNPRLKDLPSSGGIMQTMGREERLQYAASFEICYLFRLLYYLGTQYPIMGALRMSYPNDYELYKRIDEESPKKEKYVLISKFARRPSGEEINDSFEGKTRSEAKEDSGIWGFFQSFF